MERSFQKAFQFLVDESVVLPNVRDPRGTTSTLAPRCWPRSPKPISTILGLGQVDKTLFTFAGYNAGPNRIMRLRKEAQEQGLDPNKWFGNVELVAAKDIGQETVQYVSNVFKYYVAYKTTREQADLRQQAKQQPKVN